MPPEGEVSPLFLQFVAAFISDVVSLWTGKPPCTAPSLKTCLNLENLYRPFFKFKVLSKMK